MTVEAVEVSPALRTVFFNQVGTFMPSLHFYADTKIGTTKVFLSVNGAPGNMDFKLTSSPEMNESEILRLLTLREAYRDGGGGLTAADALAIPSSARARSQI